MKLLITGASGFLGGHLAELCVQAGHDVRALVRPTSRTDLLERLGAELVTGDLKDGASLRRAVQGVDAVAHVASTTGGPPEEYVAATVEGTSALLSAAEEAGVERFVHVSSVAVCSFREALAEQPAPEDLPYEDDPRFLSHYTRSKIAAELAALRHGGEAAMDVIVVRPGILYGPRGRWNISRLGYALGANCYAVIGLGRVELPVCYVRNCAAAILTAVENREVTRGVFNVVDDQGVAAREYLNALKRRVRPHLRIVPVPYLAARALAALGDLALTPLGRRSPVRPSYLMQCRRRLRYSNRRAKEILGWQPETGKEAALRATMEFFAEKERVSRRADLGRLGSAPADAPALTTCIIGCGGIAEAHLGILSRMGNAQVLALCDVDAAAAERTAERFGVGRTYTDPAEMLRTERPDVVHVLSPPQCHAEHARIAAQAGCHVLVEKPMAVDAAEAERMVQCAKRHGVKLCVDHNRLYEPRVVQARCIVESGALGRVLWVEAYYGFNLADNPASRYMAPGGAEHWTFGLPGGLYQNLAPHPLCLGLEWLGEPESMVACARDARVLAHQPTDELRVLLRTPGPCGVVTVSLAAAPRQEYLRIVGTRMTVTVDLLNKVLTRQGSAGPLPKAIGRALTNARRATALLCATARATAQVLTRRWNPYEGMDLLVREFYRAVQRGEQLPVRPEEGIQVMRVMDRIWKGIEPQGTE